jgi:protein-S-isoprenylcysteine O-methyltransferase Ste14
MVGLDFSMSPRSAFDILALLIGAGYCTIPLFWLMTHPFVERWRKLGRRAFLFILPTWAAIIAIAFLIVWPFRSAHFYMTWFAWAPAALFFLLGLSIYSAAFRSFHHTQVSGLAEIEPGRHQQHLVTTGIRARVRHPIYLGHLCEIFGWCLGSGLIALYVLAVFAVITGALMIRMEDRELGARFGGAYREYRARVPAVLPRQTSQPRTTVDHADKS